MLPLTYHGYIYITTKYRGASLARVGIKSTNYIIEQKCLREKILTKVI